MLSVRRVLAIVVRGKLEQFSAFLAKDAAHWQKIIKQIGLQLD